jgi:hypothetical protein
VALALAITGSAVSAPAASAATGYTAGGGPWNVRYCAATQCDIVGMMPNGAIPDLSCQTYGERVILGTFVTSIWDKVRTPSGAVGYLTDAGVNETPGGATFDSRLPRCTGTHGGSAYFKPRDWAPLDPDAKADYVTDNARWSYGNCSVIYGGNYPEVIGDRRVTTLAGWSLARLAPSYALQYNFARVAASIDSIILYDPGSVDDYAGGCDGNWEGRLYSEWLKANPNARLLVLAGEVTRDEEHPDSSGRLYRGIRENLFNDYISGTPQARQVRVCNYNDLSHVRCSRTSTTWFATAHSRAAHQIRCHLRRWLEPIGVPETLNDNGID